MQKENGKLTPDRVELSNTLEESTEQIGLACIIIPHQASLKPLNETANVSRARRSSS